MDEIKSGDHVTHFRAPGAVGLVVRVESDPYTSQPIYQVAWPESGYRLAIPYRSGLTVVTKCATMDCRAPAEVVVTWSGAGEDVRESVCRPCAELYLARPALTARLSPLD